MKAQVVSIGNSRGIRLPKLVIEECGFGDTVELRVQNKEVVITAHRSPRQGWKEAFATAGASRDDKLLLDLGPNEFDHDEWQW